MHAPAKETSADYQKSKIQKEWNEVEKQRWVTSEKHRGNVSTGPVYLPTVHHFMDLNSYLGESAFSLVKFPG